MSASLPSGSSPARAASERDILDEPLPRDYSAANSRGHGGGSAPSRDGWSQGSRNAGGLVHRWLLGGVALSTLMLVACTRGAAPAAPPATAGASAAAVTRDVTVRVAHVSAPTSLYEMDAQDYGTRVEAASGGRIKVQTFPNSQLGKQQELVEQTQLGALEMVIGSSEFASVVPEFAVFDLPFLFKDRAEVKRAVDGPFGTELAGLADAKGLVILGYWENGYRQITNSRRPIRVPDDLRGLKVRTPPNAERIQMFNRWGANAAPLEFSELFSALSTGVFDGQENPLAQITSAKLYEVQKYLSFSGHVYTPTYLLASKSWFDGLEPAAQRLLRDLAVQVGDASRERGEKFDDEGERTVRQAAVEINKDVDKEAFRTSGQASYEEYTRKYGQRYLDLLAPPASR